MSDSLQAGPAVTDASTDGTAPTGVKEGSAKFRGRTGELPTFRQPVVSNLFDSSNTLTGT